MCAVLAGKLQSDPYQAHLTASLPGLGREFVKACPPALSDIVPLHIKQDISSPQSLNILVQLFVQVKINHSYVLGKQIQEGVGAWPKLHLNAFNLKKLLADNILECLPFCNNTADRSQSSIARGNFWLEKISFGASIAF